MAGWAFRWLVDAAQDQCVVLQGISGSGKSHSISVLLHCLCGTNNYNNLLNQRLLNANIILNCKLDCGIPLIFLLYKYYSVFILAFGNAKTHIHGDASRFVSSLNFYKFIESWIKFM